jgi:signal transduction histidine kinase
LSARQREPWWRLLHRQPVAVFAILLVSGAALIVDYNARLARELIESKALVDAELFSQAIAEARTIYTSEVVEKLRDRVVVSHDHAGRPGTIPLPVTFSMLLGERIGQRQSGESTRLYSPFPFPFRKDGGLRDDFAKQAWRQLSRDPGRPFYRFEQVGGASVLRYASADLMRASCVDCHNTHPDTPRRNWKEGDLRGVLEVRMPMHRIEARTATGVRSSLLLTGGVALVGIALLAFVFGRLRKTQDDLVVARDQALSAARAKGEFLDNMTHELRTPLNAIIGYTELIGEELTESRQTQLLPDVGKVRTASLNLLGMVDDVLDFARIDAGNAALELSDFDVAAVVRTVVASIPDLERGGALQFTLDCPGDAGAMHGDERKLHRALRQLLANAHKFTEQGKIALRVAREREASGDFVRFEVEDSGPGMTDAQCRALFAPFSQADSSVTRRHGGAGLGLAIAMAYAKMMGGQISVQSTPGRGSTFMLRVPARITATSD